MSNPIVNINQWPDGSFLKKGTEIIKNGQLQNSITFTGYAYKYNGETANSGATLLAPTAVYDSSTGSYWIKSLDKTSMHMGSLWSSEMSVSDGGYYIEFYDSDAYIQFGLVVGAPRNNYKFKKRTVEFITPSSHQLYANIYFIDTRGMGGTYGRFVFTAPRNTTMGVKIKNMYKIIRGSNMHQHVINTYPTSYED